jgi:hypothetical protein
MSILCLQTLNIENCSLDWIPPEIAFFCSTLLEVKCSGNALSKIPEPFRTGGWARMREYLLTRIANPTRAFWKSRRLMIVGEEGMQCSGEFGEMHEPLNHSLCTHNVCLIRGVL